MWEKIRAELIKLGILKDGDTENETKLKAVVDASSKTENPTPPKTDGTDFMAALQAALAPINAKVEAMDSLLTTAQKEKIEAQKALAEQAESTRKTTIKTYLDDAEKAGKFAVAERATWEARFEKDYDGYKEILDAKPGKAPAPVTKTGGKETTTTTAQTTGTFDRAKLMAEAADVFKTGAE